MKPRILVTYSLLGGLVLVLTDTFSKGKPGKPFSILSSKAGCLFLLWSPLMFHRDQMLKRVLDGFRILTILVLVNIAWIPLFLFGKQEAKLYWRLQDKGVTTSGTVVKIHRGGKSSGLPEVAFEVNDNSYTFEFHSRMREYKVGEQVIVRYDPVDPNIAQIDSDESWKHPMFTTSLAIFLALFLNIIMISGVWRRIQFNRMAARAYRLPPQVS